MHVRHPPLTALEPNLRRNQGGAFRKDRQLQLRHASILPSPSLSRKRTGGQLIFQNGSQNHGMRSGVLMFWKSICTAGGFASLSLSLSLSLSFSLSLSGFSSSLSGAIGEGTPFFNTTA